MRMFIIYQYSDDIEVYSNDILYLKVKRKFNFFGRLISTFYIQNEIIFISTYDLFLFKKYLSIKSQNLIEKVYLLKRNGKYYLKTKSLNLLLKQHYIKNPKYTIETETFTIGEVNTKLNGFNEAPIIYQLTTTCKIEDELFCLIRFLIELSPTMDV